MISYEERLSKANIATITLGCCTTQQNQEEETMNVETNTTTEGGLNTPTFKPVPVKLTDAEVEKLLATKPLDGEVAFVTDADETDDAPAEALPTIH